jgi:hypothetical protein
MALLPIPNPEEIEKRELASRENSQWGENQYRVPRINWPYAYSVSLIVK